MSKEGQRGGCCGSKGYRAGPGGVTRKTFGRTELTLKIKHCMHPGPAVCMKDFSLVNSTPIELESTENFSFK